MCLIAQGYRLPSAAEYKAEIPIIVKIIIKKINKKFNSNIFFKFIISFFHAKN